MPNQTITQYINSLTPSTLSVRGKPYTQSTIDKYKTVVRNAFKSQNVDIDTINWDDTDATSKLIDKITPTSYIPSLLGILIVWKHELIYYSSMAEQYRAKIAEQPKKKFTQDITGLSEKIDKISDPKYRLLFKIFNTSDGVRRMADYHSLKINHYNKKTDNYITTSGRLVLNSTVKTGGVMDIQLPKDIVKLCTAVIRTLKKERDTFFSDNRNVYNKHTSKIMKTLGLSGGASQFRKIQYQDPENADDLEAYDRIKQVASNSGHSLETVKTHYS
jgi:hypothetical protein